MRLCAITDAGFASAEMPGGSQVVALIRQVSMWVEGGVDVIQLRERNLDFQARIGLAKMICTGARLSEAGPARSKLLLNLPKEAWAAPAAEAGVDGVHLGGVPDRGAVEQVRRAFQAVGKRAVVSQACHTLADVEAAAQAGADLILFAPVFEKQVAGRRVEVASTGLTQLAEACRLAGESRVFALGGVTPANAAGCVVAGAAGIAGIRLFAGEDWRILAGHASAKGEDI